MSKHLQCLTFNVKSVMWSETVGLDKKSVLVLQVWCCVMKQDGTHARRHNDLDGQSNFSVLFI